MEGISLIEKLKTHLDNTKRKNNLETL